jgi:hypothetical protein
VQAIIPALPSQTHLLVRFWLFSQSESDKRAYSIFSQHGVRWSAASSRHSGLLGWSVALSTASIPDATVVAQCLHVRGLICKATVAGEEITSAFESCVRAPDSSPNIPPKKASFLL